MAAPTSRRALQGADKLQSAARKRWCAVRATQLAGSCHKLHIDDDFDANLGLVGTAWLLLLEVPTLR